MFMISVSGIKSDNSFSFSDLDERILKLQQEEEERKRQRREKKKEKKVRGIDSCTSNLCLADLKNQYHAINFSFL